MILSELFVAGKNTDGWIQKFVLILIADDQ